MLVVAVALVAGGVAVWPAGAAVAPVAGGMCTLAAGAGGKCIDVAGAPADNAAKLVQLACNAAATDVLHAEWLAERVDGGTDPRIQERLIRATLGASHNAQLHPLDLQFDGRDGAAEAGTDNRDGERYASFDAYQRAQIGGPVHQR
ncbi:RICIN domain-containing protein [Dactylosporangium sp. CA-139066]|uniref:RICIN domain-containing protein n=1 Tax=Dactylosporangium sp. CA-139066 TaxID=3239930 RepID=UPI003D8BA996